jgi:hypothetical protein
MADTGETFKGGIHGVMGGLAAAFALYNLMTYSQTRQRRNAINAAIYFSLWALENVQAHHHWSQRD